MENKEMAEKIFRTIRCFEKRNVNLNKFGEIDPKAREIMENAKPDDVLALRLRVNSSVTIEAATHLTREGMKQITLLED